MKFMRVVVLVLAMVYAIEVASAEEQKTHPFSVHDMLAMDRLSDWQGSPDGKMIVFTRRTGARFCGAPPIVMT